MRGMGTFAGITSVDSQALPLRVHELTFWLESREDLAVERHAFEGAPFGRNYVSIDPTSVAPAASMNRNRICLHGADGGLTKGGLEGLALSFTQVKWTRYPTLLLTSALETPRAHRREDRPGYAAFSRSASIRLTTLRSTQRPNSRVSRDSERPSGVSRYSTRGVTSG